MSAHWLSELAKLTPEMEREYVAFQAEWADEIAQGRGMEVLACGMLAQAFVREHASLQPVRIKAVFDALEHLTSTGDELIGTAVSTGFLESLSNSDGRGAINMEPLADLLGPKCRAYIKGYDEFTGVPTRGILRVTEGP